MQNLKIINKKEIKKILSLLNSRFGFSKELDYAFLISNKNKIYLVNKEFSKIDTSKIRINSLGLYFGEHFDNHIRLSIEGSQLIGNDCSENILDLDYEESRNWLRGIDLAKDYSDRGFILIKHDNDFLGCGKAVDGKILNYVPKNRRLRSVD